MSGQKNSHCSYCGQAFDESQAWPRRCEACGHKTYVNPTPVSVTLLPVGKGLLAVRRTINPGKGGVGLPGGFITLGETWQEAGARELQEETTLTISSADIDLFQTLSSPDGTLLVFGLARHGIETLPEFTENDETSELIVLDGPQELVFPLHTQVVREYFERQA